MWINLAILIQIVGPPPFARKGGQTYKGGVDVEMGGCHFFSYFTIQSYLLCVWGKVRFRALLFGSSVF